VTTSAYFVHGVQLVGVDAVCEACERRPAIGRSIAGHAICPRCAGWAAHEAAELAAEMEASRRRLAAMRAGSLERVRTITAKLDDADAQSPAAKASRNRAVSQTHFNCGHSRASANTYRRSDGRRECRQCRARPRVKRHKFVCGHPRSDRNTYRHPRGFDTCRECARVRTRNAKAARRQQVTCHA
jgi:hypothetical protein